MNHPNLTKNLVAMGGTAGLTVCIIYPLRTFVQLPDFLGTALFLFFGPLLVLAYVGIYPLLARPKQSVALIVATAYGILAGAANFMFSAVQLNNLFYLRRYISSAADAATKETWQHILRGVFTVQNGLNYVSDFFIDWVIFLYAIVMWNHPRFGKWFSLTGIVAGGFHFVMKLITFPEPPKDAGLFDAGPMIGLWFLAVSIQALRSISWTTDQEVQQVGSES